VFIARIVHVAFSDGTKTTENVERIAAADYIEFLVKGHVVGNDVDVAVARHLYWNDDSDMKIEFRVRAIWTRK
jgi:hypothetical protein